MNQNRRNKLQRLQMALESEFRNRLVTALRACADGKWGLFGQRLRFDSLPDWIREVCQSKDAEGLLALGEELDAVRQKLGIAERFDLYQKFLSLRAISGPNAPGEPRIAQEWLLELESASANAPHY